MSVADTLTAEQQERLRATLPHMSATVARLNGLSAAGAVGLEVSPLYCPVTGAGATRKGAHPAPAAVCIEDRLRTTPVFRTFYTRTGKAVHVAAPAKRKHAKPKGTASPRVSRVKCTRNAATMTEAAYWGMLRSGLRRTFRWWKPALNALKAARVASKGPRGRKWLYLCAGCSQLHMRKQVQIDHVTPCGPLTCLAELPGFVERLTAEQGYQVLCTACHETKTARERETK